jgi:capsid portal protein
MKIANYKDLIEFIKINYQHLTDADYIELMSSTLGVYEHSKPNDLDKLIERITMHGMYLEQLPTNHERPLFWIVENESNVFL